MRVLTDPERAEIQHLYLVEGLSVNEIGESLKIGHGKINSLLHELGHSELMKRRRTGAGSGLRPLKVSRRGGGWNKLSEADHLKRTRPCSWCGSVAEFGSTAKRSKYCSRKCTARARSSRMLAKKAGHWGRRTVYRGTTFRSYTESRMAKRLDALKVIWQYEPQRFDLGYRRYWPDFYLPEHDVYVEVKGFWKDEYIDLAAAFELVTYKELRVITASEIAKFQVKKARI